MAVGPRYVAGLCLILLVAVIWVGASQLIQFIYTATAFDKPIFLTYFNTANFSLWLLGFGCIPQWRAMPWHPTTAEGPYHPVGEDGPDGGPPAPSNPTDGPHNADAPPTDAAEESSEGDDQRRVYSVREVIGIAVLFAPLWCGANVAFNLSLALTSVASNTILSSTSSMFVFLFGLLFLNQAFDFLKLLAVVITIGGATLVAFSDSSSGANHSFYGDSLALVGAVLYGAYVSLLSKRVVDEAAFPMPMLFGFVGLIVFVSLWPVFFLLHYTGIETFEWPSGHTLVFLLINSWVGTNLSDVLWARSVLLTSPLTATLGLSLTIPLALLSDAVLQRSKLSVRYVCGALFVVVGFTLVNTAELLRAAVVRPAEPPPSREMETPDEMH